MSVVINAAASYSPKQSVGQETRTRRRRKAVSQFEKSRCDLSGAGEITRQLISSVMDCFPAVYAAVWPCDSVTNWPVITASHGNKYIVEESSLTEWACNIISDPAINAGVDTVTTVGPRLTNASTGHAAESYAVTRLLKDQGRPAALVAMVVTKEPNRLSDVQYSLLDRVSQAYLAEIDRTVLADKLAQANLKSSINFRSIRTGSSRRRHTTCGLR